MDLEPSTGFIPVIDRRRRIDEPLPVKLVAIADVQLPCRPGVGPDLDEFYATFLGFEREFDQSVPVFQADNFRLRFIMHHQQPIEHESLRPLGIEVPSLAEVERQLVEREVEFIRQRGLSPGHDNILLRDPAGNWLELVEMRRLM